MEDRLHELRRASAAGAINNSPSVAIDIKPDPVKKQRGASIAQQDPAVNAGAATGATKQPFMEKFFEEVEGVKADIQSIKDAIKKMETIQSESLVAQNAKEAELSKALQDVIHDTNPRAARAKAMLQVR